MIYTDVVRAEAKNTSAHFALSDILARAGSATAAGGRAPAVIGDDEVTRRTLLMCLDVDNVLSEEGIRFTIRAGAEGYKAGMVIWRTARGEYGMAGVCGRVCCWAADFLQVGGYDQEPGILPSGHQEIDLVRRVSELAERLPVWADRGKRITTPRNLIGFVVPNATDIVADRGSAKLANVAPEVLRTGLNF